MATVLFLVFFVGTPIAILVWSVRQGPFRSYPIEWDEDASTNDS